MQSELVVVIRAVCERTLDVCKQQVLSQLPESAVYIVIDQPFEVTLHRCYEVGIKSNAQWMITVDADVLLTSSSIQGLISAAQAMPENYIQLEGRVFDKILGTYRQAGHRIYRTSLLPQALKHIPAEGTEIRPEYHTLQQMAAHGYPSRRIGQVFGLHDYEQNFADLYRKAVVHAKKHTYLIPSLVERCITNLEDDDFKVILKGLYDGIIYTNKVSIDRRKFLDSAQAALDSLNLKEKDPINNLDGFTKDFHSTLDEVISQTPVPSFQTTDLFAPSGQINHSSWRSKIQARITERGLIRGSIASAGALLTRIGQYLDS